MGSAPDAHGPVVMSTPWLLPERPRVVLLGDSWTHGVEPAIDVALLGRYYERIGDHAVSLGRRVVYLVTGEVPQRL